MTFVIEKSSESTFLQKKAPHFRTSKTGKIFQAGKGVKKNKDEDISKKMKNNTLQVNNISPENIDELKNKIRTNKYIKEFLNKQYEKLARREKGQGERIKLRPIQLLAALETGKFVFISAGNNTVNNPKEHANKGPLYFNKKNKELQQDLKKEGFLFNECIGKYGQIEKSILAMVHDVQDEEKLYEIGKKYLQHSIVFSDNTEKGKRRNKLIKCYTPGKESISGTDYKVVSEKESIQEDQCYTSIPLTNGKSVKILLSIPLDNEKNTFWRN